MINVVYSVKKECRNGNRLFSVVVGDIENVGRNFLGEVKHDIVFDSFSRKFFISDKYDKVGNEVIHRESGCKFYLPKAEKLLKYQMVVSALVDAVSRGTEGVPAGEYYILLKNALHRVYLIKEGETYRISPEYYPIVAEAVDILSPYELTQNIKTLYQWERELGRLKTGQLITGCDRPYKLVTTQDEMGSLYDAVIDLSTGKVVYEEEPHYLPVDSWESYISQAEAQKIMARKP